MAKLTPLPWCPEAVPTPKGWVKPNLPGKEGHPELVKAMKISQADIDEYNGNEEKPAKKASRKKKTETVTEQKENEQVVLTEAPVPGKKLDEMTEEQLEALKETTGQSGQTLTE